MEVGRGLADCLFMKVGPAMRAFALVLFSDKYAIGEFLKATDSVFILHSKIFWKSTLLELYLLTAFVLIILSQCSADSKNIKPFCFGVPQGTMLYPHFFIIYVNDCPPPGERIVCVNAETGKDNKFAGKMQGPYSRLLPLSVKDTMVAIPHLSKYLHVLKLNGEVSKSFLKLKNQLT